ncbi:MAG TPA: L,D-transpeptidase family protein, partial [Solirubrobacteraceae bacterium]
MRRLLVPVAVLFALPVHTALAAPPAVAVQAAPALGAAPLTTTLTAAGDAVWYRWELPGGATASGPQVAATFQAGRWVVGVVGTSATGEETRATVTVTAVSLSVAAPRVVTYRARAFLTGRIVPALPGARLGVRRDARAAGHGVVHAGGRLRIGIRPRVPGSYTVAFGGAVSNAVPVAVRPRVTIDVVGPPVVGARLTARTSVQPAAAGRLTTSVYRRAQLVARGHSSVRLATGRPGAFRIVAAVEPRPGFVRGSAIADAVVHVPDLGWGSTGGSVRELARRLAALGYALEGADSTFGYDDYEAVLAFQKLHGLPRSGRVDARFWALLDRARAPRARYGGDHIEVDKTRQVLFLVRHGRVVLIAPVSTGATGNTPIGRFRVYRKVVGWDWVLWYPMYFLRGFAIHGYPDVPAYPA